MTWAFVDIASIQCCIRVPDIGVKVASCFEALFWRISWRRHIFDSIIICWVILWHNAFVQNFCKSIWHINTILHGSCACIRLTIWWLLVMVKVLVNTFSITGGPVIVLKLLFIIVVPDDEWYHGILPYLLLIFPARLHVVSILLGLHWYTLWLTKFMYCAALQVPNWLVLHFFFVPAQMLCYLADSVVVQGTGFVVDARNLCGSCFLIMQIHVLVIQG